MFIQITKAVCSACGCSIKAKTRLKMAVCGLEEIDLTPKWREKEN